jgi:hypothetical protein
MKDFNLDSQKALELATELGLEVSFDSEKPGVYILNNGDETFYKFQDFFPEIFNYTLDVYVTKETNNLEELSEKISRPIRREIKSIGIEDKFKEFGLYFDAA